LTPFWWENPRFKVRFFTYLGNGEIAPETEPTARKPPIRLPFRPVTRGERARSMASPGAKPPPPPREGRVYERVSGDFGQEAALAAAAAASVTAPLTAAALAASASLPEPEEELSEGFICPICIEAFATKEELLACMQAH
jgi:hypothetical protein